LSISISTHATPLVFQWEEFQQESQREDYIAIGCTSGVYVSKRTELTKDYCESSSRLGPAPLVTNLLCPAAFRKILEFNGPNTMVAIPEFDKFLIHCDSALFSFPLEKVVRASRAVQGDAAIKDLVASQEKLSKDEENVLFLKSGRLVEKKSRTESLDRSNRSYLRYKDEEFREGHVACARIETRR